MTKNVHGVLHTALRCYGTYLLLSAGSLAAFNHPWLQRGMVSVWMFGWAWAAVRRGKERQPIRDWAVAMVCFLSPGLILDVASCTGVFGSAELLEFWYHPFVPILEWLQGRWGKPVAVLYVPAPASCGLARAVYHSVGSTCAEGSAGRTLASSTRKPGTATASRTRAVMTRYGPTTEYRLLMARKSYV